MNKVKLMLTTLCLSVLAACSVGLAACQRSKPSGHEHAYSTEWSSDSGNHFHACKDTSCTSVKDSEPHQYGNWTVDTPATVETKGRDKRQCSVCKYVEYRDTDKLTPSPAHSHVWSDWTVTSANKPTEKKEGKATRTCSGSGECGATLADKEYTLPVLTSKDYSTTADTATCSATGSITYTYNKNGVSTSFDVATPIKADAHNYGKYTYADDYTRDEGHYKVCKNNSAHKTELEEHDFEGEGGACSKCGYMWDNMITPTTPSVTFYVGGDSPACKVYGYPLAPEYYTYTYTGEKPITVSYRYYRLGDKGETTGTVTLSRDGRRSFSAYLETKATCTMVITSDEETAFQATLQLTYHGQTNPDRTEKFKLNMDAQVRTTYDGVKYEFTAEEEYYYVLTCRSASSRVFVLNGDGSKEAVSSPYTFHLDAEEKITFLMCSVGDTATYSAKITKITADDCDHSYSTKVVAPTCTKDGYTTYTCDICGDSYDDNYTDKIAHNYEYTVTKESTCTKNGTKKGVCSECKAEVEEPVAKKPHDTEGVKWQTVKEANCTEAGQEQKECKVCHNVVETQEIPVDEDAHDFGEFVNNDPDGHYKVCAHNDGHTTTKTAHDFAGEGGACSVCGYVWQNMIKPANPTVTVNVGGGNTATVYGYAPSAAYYTYTYKGEKAINVSYSYTLNGEETTETATLSRDGQRSFSVYLAAKAVCTMTVTSSEATAFEATIKLTYNGSVNPYRTETFTLNTSKTINATYDGVKYEFTAETEYGYVLTCTGTNAANARVLVLDENGNKEAVELPYAFQPGEGNKITFLMCSVDEDATYTARIKEISSNECEHDYSAGDVVAPTCTEKGYTVYTCGICGDSYDDFTDDMIPHSYVYEVKKEATCTEKGSRTGVCSKCDDTVVEEIAMAPHDTEGAEWQIVKAANCTVTGQEKLYCNVCHNAVQTQVISVIADAHNYGDYTYTDETGHYKVCKNSAAHKTELEEHDFAGDGGACSVCDYEWQNMIKPANPTVTVNVGGGKTATVYGYAPSAAYYTYTYKGDKAITVSYSYTLNDEQKTGTATLSRDGQRSFSVYLKAKAICTMEVTSAEATAFDATIKLTYNGPVDPYRTETFTLNTSTTINATYDGVKYEFTASTDYYYVLTCTGGSPRVLVLNADGNKEAATLPYAFQPGAGNKITFLMCSVDEDSTYSAKIAKITTEQCKQKFDHHYAEEVKAPTCTSQGYTTYNCDLCGHSYVDGYTDELPHDYKYTVTIAPKCTDYGKRTGVCNDCGDTVYEDVAMLPHKTDTADWQTVKEANCTEKGQEKLCCTVCNNVVDTREVETNDVHSYAVTVTKKPTLTEEGEAQLICNHNEDHKGAFVALPELTSSEYAMSENGQFVTYVIMTEIGEATFTQEVEEIRSIGKAIEYAVSTSDMTVNSNISFNLSAVQGGGSGEITYEFGDNYVHATDGYMNTERWISLKNDGTFFAMIEKEDRNDQRHIMRDTSVCLDDFKGYGFRFIFAQQEWEMPQVYGAAQFVSVLYKFASQNSNSKNFAQDIETKNGKTYYTFSYRFIDPDPHDNTDMNHMISIEFTLNGDYFMDYCKIIGQSFRGKTLAAGETLATQTFTVTQHSRRGVGEQAPVNPYNEDEITLNDYKLRYATVDDSFENITLGSYFPNSNQNDNQITAAHITYTCTLQVVEYSPASGVNFFYDVLQIYLRKHGESGLGELLDGSYEDGEEGHVLASFDPISRLVSLGFYVAGDYDLIFRTVKTEKVFTFNISIQDPTKIDAYVYVEDTVSGEGAWKSEISDFTMVTGYSLSFYGRVPHPGYQYSDYTVEVEKDGAAVYGLLTETDGIYVFTPNAVGSYTITLTTTHGNRTKSFNVQVLNAPDLAYLDGKFVNDFKEVSIQFNSVQSLFTLNVGGTTGVYRYTLNGTVLTKSLVSGTNTEFSLYFNSASELIFEKDGEKAIMFKVGEANAILGDWTLNQAEGLSIGIVLLKVNVTSTYYFSVSGEYTYEGSDGLLSWTGYTLDGGEDAIPVMEAFALELKSGQTIQFNTGKPGRTLTVVELVSVESVELNETSIDLAVGGTFSLIATINPSNATNTMKTWSSSDESVATVSKSGYVIAIGAGTAEITVTTADGGKTATCTVTVRRIDVESVTISGSTHTLYMNGTLTLTATVLPANATDGTVTWISSNTAVATVDENGVVTPVGVGETTITATADGVNSTGWTVTVENVPVESVTLNYTELNLKVYETANLTATINPANGSYVSKEWLSSNPAVATVNGNGLVTAIAAGDATITFKMVTNTETFEITCTVNVSTVAVSGITLSAIAKDVNKGDTFTLTATITPSDATNKNVTWSSSDESVATVDQNGNVTAVGAGIATITCTAEGTTVSASCNVTVTSLSYGVGEHDFSYATATSHTFTIDGVVGRSYKLTVVYASNGKTYNYNKFYVDGVLKNTYSVAACEVTLANEDTQITVEKSSSSTTTLAFKLIISEVEVAVGEELTLALVDTWGGVTVQLSGCVVGKEYRVTVSKDDKICTDAQIKIPALGLFYGYYGEITFTYAQGVSVDVVSAGYSYIQNLILTLEQVGGESVEHSDEHELSYISKDANEHTVICSVAGCNFVPFEDNHAFDDDNDTYCEHCGYMRVVHDDSHILYYTTKNANKHTATCSVDDCNFVAFDEDHNFVNGYCNVCGCQKVLDGGTVSVGGELTIASLGSDAVSVQLSGCEVGKQYKLTVLKDGATCNEVSISSIALGIYPYMGKCGEVTFTYADGASVDLATNYGTLTNLTVTLEEVGGGNQGGDEFVLEITETNTDYTFNGEAGKKYYIRIVASGWAAYSAIINGNSHMCIDDWNTYKSYYEGEVNADANGNIIINIETLEEGYTYTVTITEA